MRILFSKKGSCVIQNLIIIAVMGMLAITSVVGIHRVVISKTEVTNNTLLESKQIDVDYLINH